MLATSSVELLQRVLLALLVVASGVEPPPSQVRAEHHGAVSAPSGDDEARAQPRLTDCDLRVAPPMPVAGRARAFAIRLAPPSRAVVPASAVVARARATRFVTRPRMRRPRGFDPDDD